MRPFFFIGLGLLALSAIAWAIRPAGGDGRTPLVWLCDDAPTRRLTIELFEKLHPENDLRLDPDNTRMEKIIVQSLGGVGPDVFDCRSPNQLAAFVQSGIAGDITGDLKAAGIDLAAESWPLVLKHFTLDGRVYGVPANAGVDALWFNKEIFEREGIPFPHELEDWPAVVALAERLTVHDAAGRVTRFGLSFDDAEWLLLLHNFGGNVFSADGTRCALDSPQAIAAVQFIQDLIFKYKVTASPGEQDAAAQEGGWGNYSMRALVGGHAAMSFGGRWWLLTLRKDPALRLGVAVLPTMPGGFMMGGGKATLLNAKTPHRKEAMEFLKFMAGPEYNRLLNREADAMGGIIRYATDGPVSSPAPIAASVRGQSHGHPFIRHGILILLALTAIAPFLWMVLSSFKPLTEVEKLNPLPSRWQPENYLQVFKQISFARYYFNSVLVSAWVTFLTCLTSAMAAFAFSRLKWPGREAVFKLYLATMMVPGVVTMIPNYTVMVKLHLLDSYAGLIVPASFSAFGTFLLRQFMLTIHPALDESAGMDGAGPWTIFSSIILPLSRPGLITLAIFTFMGTYGSFFWPLVMIKSDHLRTLPIGMMYFDSIYGKQTNLLMAASVMNIVPLIILFVCTQKFLVKGIQFGSVKG